MSRRPKKKKKKKRPNRSPSSLPGGSLPKMNLDSLRALFSGHPQIDRLLSLRAGGSGNAPIAELPQRQSNHPSMTPEDTAEMLEGAASSCYENHSAALQRKARQKPVAISIEDFEPETYIEALVGSNASNKQRVEFAYDHDELSYTVNCSCGKDPCVHTCQLMIEIVDQVQDDGSEISCLIFGEGHAERQREAEQQRQVSERERNQQRLFSLIQRTGSAAQPESVGLDAAQVSEFERVQWNLNVEIRYGTPDIELKVIRQKEKKAGGWTKGREVGIKNFMEMPREGWTKIDFAIAAKTKSLHWHPHFELNDGDAFSILEGSDVFHLNREPATLHVHPYELVVLEKGEAGWRLTTSAEVLKTDWGRDALRVSCNEGTLVYSIQRCEVAWVPTPASISDLNRYVTTEDVEFTNDQRDVLLSKLNELQGTVPLRMPVSLAGEEVAEEIESILLLRMKKTGVVEATVCVRNSRQLLVLPGDGLLRRQETVDGKPVQYVRDGSAERRAARAVTKELSLDSFRGIRDWTWLVDDPDSVVDLLSTAGDLVSDGRVTMVWHKESARELNIIGNVSAANVSVTVSRQRDWFGVNGTCQVGDQEVSLKDLLAGLRGTTTMAGFVEISPGQWAAIADDFRLTLQRLADVANENRGKLQIDSSAAMALSTIEEQSLNIEADRAWQKCLNKVRSIETINPDPPAALNCDLRDYQVEGFRWMCRLSEWGVGGILADDMGLGKTVQTLAILLRRMESGPSLVIAPTSLGFNWEQECNRFAPSLTPRLLRESDRQELINNATEGDVIICSYGLALRETELLQSVNWGTLVLDEAQNVKNSNAKTAKEIRKLKADWKVALTGTPMENHLGELWSLFRAVSPGILGSWEQFRRKFATPIEKENNNERRQSLSRLISPFILRRSKSEVLTDLPERSESNLMIELSKEERERYDQVRLAAVGELDSLGDSDLSGDQRFKVLQLLTRLRQISCHVGLIDDKWTKGSSKLTMLMERLEQLKERGHRPLIFSQFTSHLALIKEACDAAKISYQYLDGQTTPKARQQRVEAFQNGEGDAFLISLKAGGTGLNLTAADYVIHMDPWWNPAVEDQATDRAHRIGQKKSVMVYRIVAKGTIEEQILSLHEEKRDLVEGVLSGSEASGKMTTEQLAGLIRTGVTEPV